MRSVERWRARGETIEAMLLLALARLLVARVPLGRWRASLGEAVAPIAGAALLRLDVNAGPRQLAGAVARAAARLPGESLCLPRAMALHWLLRRRGLGSELQIGVRPHQARGGIGDLHAWVVRDGEVLIGATGEPHHPIFAARTRTGK